MAIPNELIILGLAYIMMFVGLSMKKYRIIKVLGAMFVMVMGVYTIFPGYGGISGSEIIGLTLGTISIGLGAYFMMEGSFSHDKQVDSYNQHDDGRFHDND